MLIESFAWGGAGVGRIDGKVCFVSKCVPGDRVALSVTRERRGYLEGRAERILEASPDRVPPRCAVFDRCGGCQWLAAAYPLQLREKVGLLKGALRRHLDGVQMDPIERGEGDLGYRHRGRLHIAGTAGKPILGFYEEGSHRVVDLESCPLFSQGFNARLRSIREGLRAIAPGEMPSEVDLALSEGDAAAAARFHFRGRGYEASGETLLRLSRQWGLDGALVTAGAGAEEMGSCGLPETAFTVPAAAPGAGRDLLLRASVRSFTQAHYFLNRRLVLGALEFLDLTPGESLLDLYAGIGNFSLPAAAAGVWVTAVEGSPWAVRDARANAAREAIEGFRMVQDSSGRAVDALAREGKTFGAVLLDPPRAGAREVAAKLQRLGAGRILYVSCDLPTLARDLGILSDAGFRLRRVRPVDMFPQTYGVETLCLLEPRP